MTRTTALLLAAHAVTLPSAARATNYFYSSPVDLAAIPYTGDDHITLSATAATASADTTIPSPFQFSASPTLNLDHHLTLTGVLVGSGGTLPGLTKSGPATLTLAADSPNYVSPITLSAGTLRLGSDTAIGTTTPAHGPGDLYLNAGGTLDLNGFATPRILHYNAGALINDDPAHPVDLPAGPLATGIYVLGGAGDITFNSQLFSSGSFTKIGPGTVTLTNTLNNGNYYGTFYVNGGTLRFANAGAFGNPSTNVQLNPGGTLDLNGLVSRKSFTFAGGTLANNNTTTPVLLDSSTFYAYGAPPGNPTFGGAGDISLNSTLDANGKTLIKTGPGTLTLNAAPHTTQGAQVLAGTLRIGGNDKLPVGGTTSVLPGGALDLNGFSSPSTPIDVAGGALLNNNTATPVTLTPQFSFFTLSGPTVTLGGAGDMTFNGQLASTQSLTKIGAGTLTLTNSSPYVGATLAGGVTVTSQDSKLGTFGATLTITDGLLRPSTPFSLTRPVSLLGSAGGFDTSLAQMTISRAVTGSGALHKYGTNTLILISTVNIGPLVVHEGSVSLSQGNPIVTSLSVDPAASLTMASPVTRMFIDVPEGSPLPLDSVRTLLANSYNGGDWLGTGGITTTRLSPENDPTRTHALAYADGSLFSESFRRTSATNVVDTSSVVIRFTSFGDANCDGVLTPDDYTIIDRTLAGSAVPDPHWTDGDFNYDGTVDAADYLLLDLSYLVTQPPPSPSLLADRESRFGPDYVSSLLSSLPEPSALSSILYPLSSLLLPRRRRA